MRVESATHSLRHRRRTTAAANGRLACEPLETRRLLATLAGGDLLAIPDDGTTVSAVSAAVLAIDNQSQTFATLTDTTVTMTGGSELFITGTGNPITGSIVHLNSADAWLYFPAIKPSVVQSTLLSQVRVNGAAAVSGANVRVVQYGAGTVVIPHAPSYQPLVGYTGPNFTGVSKAFGLYTYNTTDATLGAMKGDLSSFTLKRGYMATIATNSNGSGTSKVFVAQDHDLDIAILPSGLDNQAQFIRVIPWRWVAKKGASDVAADTLDASWQYNWNNNLDSTLDWEYVPIKQQPYWPGLPTTKQNITSQLGFNEPNNPVEDAYVNLGNGSVDAAIALWPDLLSTGLRVGSPAVTDGGKAWLYEFMDKAIAANLRVDFIAIHNYQAGHTASSLNNWLADVYNRYHLPIWVTEFNNGANWTGGTDPTLQQNADWVASITDMFDNTPWIERYSIYSNVEAVRQMVDSSGNLTPAGLVYKNNASPIGYVQEPSVRANTAGRGIAQLPLDGTTLDTSGYGNSGELVGADSYVTGQQGQALEFDGTRTYVQLPANVATGAAFSFAAWVNRDGGGNWQRIFDFGTGTSSYMFLTASNGSKLRFAIKNGGAEQIVETDPIPTGQWAHIAVTLGSGSAKLYVNGSLVATNNAVTLTPSSFNPTKNYLGKSQFGADPLFAGTIDSVVITDTVLTPSQVVGLMTNSPPQFDAPLITMPGVSRGTLFTGSVAGRATDPNASDTITYAKANGPAWLTVASNGAMWGTPTADDQGPQEFVITATDTKGAMAATTVVVPLSALYWRGDVNNNWSLNVAGNTNWSTNQAGTVEAGAVPAITTDVIIGASTTGYLPNLTLGANAAARGILVTASTGVTIGGTQTLTIGEGGVQVAPGGGASTISTTGQVILEASQEWSITNALSVSSPISGTAALTKSGSATLTITGAATHTGGTVISEGTVKIGAGGSVGSLAGNVLNNGELNVDRADDLTFSGSISGTGSLRKTSAGRLILTASSSYSGGTTVGNVTGAGVVRASASNALGSGAVLIGPSGNATTARLELSNNVTVSNAISLPMRTNGSAAIQNISGTNVLSGTITLDVGGSYAVLQSDAGLLTTGGITTVATGARVVTLQGNGAGRIGGVVSNGSGTMSIAKAGFGTWTLAGANTYSGETKVTAGTLALGASNRIADSSPITLNGGTFSTGGFSDTVGALSLSANSTIDFGTGTSVLSFTSLGTLTAGRTLSITNWTSGSDVLWIGTTLTSAQLAQITFNGMAARQLPSGEIRPVGGIDDVWYAIDETAGTSLADGSGGGRTATATGAFTFTTGTSGNAIRLGGGRVELPVGVVGASTSFTVATWVKLDSLSSFSRVFDFGTGTSVNMFLTPRSASGTPRFAITTSSGAGEQRIDASSALTAGVWTHLAVTISGSVGTLYVNGVVAGTNAAMTLSPASLGLTTNNWIGDSQYAADPSLLGSIDDFRLYARALSQADVQALMNPDVTVTVSAGQTMTDGQHAGDMSVTKDGDGTLVLTTANTHTGGTVIAAGTVIVRNAAAFGTGGVEVKAGATLQLDIGPGAVTLPALTIGDGGRVDVGTGRITVTSGLTASQVLALLVAGRGDGMWDGASGFMTRSAVPDAGLGLGYLVNDDGSVTVGYAAAGDVNMDGQIDILDVSSLLGAASLDTVVTQGWSEGDFNYDGICDSLDIGAFLATNLLDQGPYLSASAAAFASLTAEGQTNGTSTKSLVFATL